MGGIQGIGMIGSPWISKKSDTTPLLMMNISESRSFRTVDEEKEGRREEAGMVQRTYGRDRQGNPGSVTGLLGE